MAGRLSIGELAEAAGVTTSAVRYYERVGLLSPAGRTSSNYRYYDAPAVQRLRFIRAAHGAGFTLDDVATLLDLKDGSLEPCAEVRELIERRLDGVTRLLGDYRRVQKSLKEGLARCRAACDPRRCEVLEELAGEGGRPQGS